MNTLKTMIIRCAAPGCVNAIEIPVASKKVNEDYLFNIATKSGWMRTIGMRFYCPAHNIYRKKDKPNIKPKE